MFYWISCVVIPRAGNLGDIKSFTSLQTFLTDIGERVREELISAPFIQRLPDGLIKDRILDYSLQGGKCLRPALTCAACGAVGSDPWKALPVGVAIEMFHTWTLVHDDIIDRDQFRRGGPTVHHRIYNDYANWSQGKPSIPRDHLAHSLALLTGDAQHGFVMDILTRAGLEKILPPELVLHLIYLLEGQVLPDLLSGEVSDVLQTGLTLESITEQEIERMLQQKTGVLLTFATIAGGLIGLNTVDHNHPFINALNRYGSNLGLAFQLRDDILGIYGDEQKLGKPIGSDFREGKRTLIVKYAYEASDTNTRKYFKSLLGKSDLNQDEISILKKLVTDSGATERVEQKSENLIETSRTALKILPDSKFKQILIDIADYTVYRQK
jgi:geranylgeranyl diphosphate synthase, type I